MTLAEAEAEVVRWRSYADTVGGDAIIVRNPNVASDLSPSANGDSKINPGAAAGGD